MMTVTILLLIHYRNLIICMNLIKTLCARCRACLTNCFRTEEDQIKDKMIELKNKIHSPLLDHPRKLKKIDSDHQITISNKEPHASTEQINFARPSQLSSSLNNPFCSQTEKNQKKLNKLFSQKTHSINNNISLSPNNRNSNNSSDSFMTMQSASVGSNNSISRRTFKSLSKKSSQLRKGFKINGSGSDFKSIRNRQSMNLMTPFLHSLDSKVQKYSEALIEWNQKQYEPYMNPPLSMFLSQSQKMKLQSNSFLDQIVNKLEDYYMFSIPEQMSECNKKGSSLNQNRNSNRGFYSYKADVGYYINSLTNFKGSYQSENDSAGFFQFPVAHKTQSSSTNFMKLVTFCCNTSNPLEFLVWFNSLETRARLYDFNSTQMIQNGIFPIFHVQQYSGLLSTKNKYLMVRQIQLVKFDNQPDKEYIIQLDCSYGGGVGEQNGRNFKSLLRFEVGENSMVQIYSESSEKIEKATHGYYFGEQWRSFQEKLLRDKILKSSFKPISNKR